MDVSYWLIQIPEFPGAWVMQRVPAKQREKQAARDLKRRKSYFLDVLMRNNRNQLYYHSRSSREILTAPTKMPVFSQETSQISSWRNKGQCLQRVFTLSSFSLLIFPNWENWSKGICDQRDPKIIFHTGATGYWSICVDLKHSKCLLRYKQNHTGSCCATPLNLVYI